MEITKTTLSLRNLRFHAHHGVMPQERLTGSNFLVSLIVDANLCEACRSDKVADTINYALLYDLVKEEMSQPSDLIENVAYRIGRSIIDNVRKVDAVEVTVTKQNPPMGAQCDGASITININRCNN